MELTQKLVNLTPGQREKFAAIKDAAALDAFIIEHGIDLTPEEKQVVSEYLETGILPLSDDDLDAVAGGAAKDLAPEMAMADKRYYMLPAQNYLCICDHQNKWAKMRVDHVSCYVYYNVKCYKCGRTWEEYRNAL